MKVFGGARAKYMFNKFWDFRAEFAALAVLVAYILLIYAYFGILYGAFWFVWSIWVLAFLLRHRTGHKWVNLNSPVGNSKCMKDLFAESWLPRPGANGIVIDFGGTGQFEDAAPIVGGVTCAVRYISYEYEGAFDVDLLCIPENSADMCIMSGVVEYLSDRDLDSVLCMARHVLNPGGAIIVFEGAFDFVPWIERPFAWTMGWLATSLIGQRIRYRMPPEIEAALKRAGFRDTEIRRRFYAPYGRLSSASHMVRAVK